MKRNWGGAAMAPPPRIATKAELDRLRRTRPKPQPEPSLHPDGPEADQIKHRIADLHENRITDLQTRLDTLRETADREFTLSSHQGRAKTDFDRSR